MTLGIGAHNSTVANPSPAAPRDKSGSRLSQGPSGNTRTDAAESRRAESLANAEQAEARAQQVAKEVLDIKGVEEKAAESTQRIDTYA